MSIDRKIPRTIIFRVVCVLMLVMAFVIIWQVGRRGRPSPGTMAEQTPGKAVSGGSSSTPASVGQQPPASGAAPTFAGFRLRPLPVARQSTAHQWTAEDARLPDAIRQIAHNEQEAERMLEENAHQAPAARLSQGAGVGARRAC
jgi:hypothetical protein